MGYFLLDRNLLPDFLLRIGIRSLCEQRKKQIEDRPLDGERLFRQGLEGMPICICTEDANEQHYEVCTCALIMECGYDCRSYFHTSMNYCEDAYIYCNFLIVSFVMPLIVLI